MEKTIGVILLNLGGPTTLDDVEPFLFNLFSDRKIIRLGPWFLQKPIARWIAKKRAPKSRESYRKIGGGSPLNKITLDQCAALERELCKKAPFRVGMAMRYWHPFAAETLSSFLGAGIERIAALGLYPHYSVATTGSSMDDLQRAAEKITSSPDIAEISSWPEQPDYIRALAETIIDGMKAMAGEKVTLLYSAHSLPVKFIEEGDPYLDHLHRTIHAVEKITGISGVLCFQSRSGPVKWLEPSTPDTIKRLASEGCRHVLAVPISFVSDHVETLYEIDMQYAEMAQSLGMTLRRTESLNVRPAFIEGLRSLVLDICEHKGWL